MKKILLYALLFSSFSARAAHGDTLVIILEKFTYDIPFISAHNANCKLIEERYILFEKSTEAETREAGEALAKSKYCIFIDPDYRIIMEFYWRNDEYKIIGAITKYHKNGAIKEKGVYHQGNEYGHYYYYNKRGRLKEHRYYSNPLYR